MPLLDTILDIMRASEPDDEEQSIAIELISNIASTSNENTTLLVDLGVIEATMKLTRQLKPINVFQFRTLESAIWTLGNIAGDSTPLRDKVIKAGAMQALIPHLLAAADEHTTSATSRIAMWAASNLPRGGHFDESLMHLAPIVSKLLGKNDVELVTDALWTLSFLSDGPDHRQRFVASIPRLPETIVKFLGSVEVSKIVPALRTAGNILAGDDKTADIMRHAGVVNAIIPLLFYYKTGVRKEACWSLSNLLGGTAAQVVHCLELDVLRHIVSIILDNVAADVTKEASWCLVNAVAGCPKSHIPTILETPHFMNALASTLNHFDNSLVSYAAAGAVSILRFISNNEQYLLPDGSNPVTEFLRQACLQRLLAVHNRTPDMNRLMQWFEAPPSPMLCESQFSQST